MIVLNKDKCCVNIDNNRYRDGVSPVVTYEDDLVRVERERERERAGAPSWFSSFTPL